MARTIHSLSPRAQGPVRRRQLRRPARHAAGIGALRLQGRRLHRRAKDKPGRFALAGAAPSSSTRSARSAPRCRCGSCACSRSAPTSRWARHASETTDVRVIVATNQDLAERIRQGRVPRGPLLPHQRRPRGASAAAQPQGGHSRSWSSSSSSVSTGFSRNPSRGSHPRRSPCSWPTTGPETSASSRT